MMNTKKQYSAEEFKNKYLLNEDRFINFGAHRLKVQKDVLDKHTGKLSYEEGLVGKPHKIFKSDAELHEVIREICDELELEITQEELNTVSIFKNYIYGGVTSDINNLLNKKYINKIAQDIKLIKNELTSIQFTSFQNQFYVHVGQEIYGMIIDFVEKTNSEFNMDIAETRSIKEWLKTDDDLFNELITKVKEKYPMQIKESLSLETFADFDELSTCLTKNYLNSFYNEKN